MRRALAGFLTSHIGEISLLASECPRTAPRLSATMGHATAAFTANVYVTTLDEMAESAASAIEAFVPRRKRDAVISGSSGAEDEH
jgi:hypothetical protein